MKQYLNNQKTNSGEKLELPQELLDIASQAEKDGENDKNNETENTSEKQE